MKIHGLNLLLFCCIATPALAAEISAGDAVLHLDPNGRIQAGIAFLTPPLFTPLFGPILAVAFRVPRTSIFMWMTLSAIVWGLGISYIAHKVTFIQDWIK